MNLTDVPRLRMHNQRITVPSFEGPEEIVSWFGAMQVQDYAAVKWAVSLRSNNLTDNLLNRAFAEGKILRTHVLRPTWQFVTPADIGWMLQLSAKRVHEQMTPWYRSSGLDTAVFKKKKQIR